MIRYHPAVTRKKGREERKKMAVLEINDSDDSVTILFVREEGRENGKKIAVLKKND